MKSTTVISAAQLLDQLYKLNDFIDRAPHTCNTLTITFRDGDRSKSLTLRDHATIINIQQFVEGVRDKTSMTITKLGVDIEE